MRVCVCACVRVVERGSQWRSGHVSRHKSRYPNPSPPPSSTAGPSLTSQQGFLMLCMSPFATLHERALDRVGERVYFMAVGCSVYFVLFLVMVFGGELP